MESESRADWVRGFSIVLRYTIAMNTVMGIDNGSHKVGYAVICGFSLIDAGVIHAKSKNTGERLRTIYEESSKLIREHRPRIIAIETPFINRRFLNAAIPLGQSRGVLILAAVLANVPYLDVSPSEAKAIVGAKMVGKSSVQRAVMGMFGLSEEPPPDVADALALAVFAASQISPDNRN